MKTPTLIAADSKSSRASCHSRMLPLLAALTLLCSGSSLGPLHGGHEPQTPRPCTEAGVAQADTARELAAKLSSLNGVVRVGLVLFLVGLLSLAYPPLRTLVHGVNTRLALLLGGVGLMVLPTLIVGNEHLFLGALVLGLGAGCLSNRVLHQPRASGKTPGACHR